MEEYNYRNLIEHTVSDVASAVKNIIEDSLPIIKVRGEVSGLKKAASGHIYFNLKDSKALLAVVCWQQVSNNLPFLPQDGMEIICIGKVTTYMGQSKYQIVMEYASIFGEGELAALLEKRKQKLLKEGLFDNSLKKPIPFLPDSIGIITSSSGAVIKDIINRIEDRFPTKLLLWSVTVQGSQSAKQVAEAIRGFNKFTPKGIEVQKEGTSYVRPDLLIVARGGGSLEDLWPFNEEIVVRAVVDSEIPIISAIGHETDVTLIDYAADLRAATPSAAAELSVPVRSDLDSVIKDLHKRLSNNISKIFEYKKEKLENFYRTLPNIGSFIAENIQKIDDLEMSLKKAMINYLESKDNRLNIASLRLIAPYNIIDSNFAKIKFFIDSLNFSTNRHLSKYESKIDIASKLLSSYNYKNILKRGFALVYGDDNLLKSSKEVSNYNILKVKFHDGTKVLKLQSSSEKVNNTTKSNNTKVKVDNTQEDLF